MSTMWGYLTDTWERLPEPAMAPHRLSEFVTAQRTAAAWIRDELERAMLERASADKAVGRRAAAIIKGLDAQARPGIPAPMA